MNELNELKRRSKCIKEFLDSQFCPYIDIDSKFPYTSYSNFFFSLFINDFNKESELYINEKSFSEYAVDVYLSKINNLRSYSFLFLYNLCLKNENERNIRRLDDMDIDKNKIFFESCKKNFVHIVNHLIEKGFFVNTKNEE